MFYGYDDIITHTNTCTGSSPFHLIIRPGGEGRALQYFTHLFSTEAEVVYGPHVGKFHYLDLQDHQRLPSVKTDNTNNHTNEQSILDNNRRTN